MLVKLFNLERTLDKLLNPVSENFSLLNNKQI